MRGVACSYAGNAPICSIVVILSGEGCGSFALGVFRAVTLTVGVTPMEPLSGAPGELGVGQGDQAAHVSMWGSSLRAARVMHLRDWLAKGGEWTAAGAAALSR